MSENQEQIRKKYTELCTQLGHVEQQLMNLLNQKTQIKTQIDGLEIGLMVVSQLQPVEGPVKGNEKDDSEHASAA
jgi:chaperonin cofactor prefoldin|tara:strand:+ start:307 stop:531 length:225 start_codon:yes stop_codon:yes gene_type:complete